MSVDSRRTLVVVGGDHSQDANLRRLLNDAGWNLRSVDFDFEAAVAAARGEANAILIRQRDLPAAASGFLAMLRAGEPSPFVIISYVPGIDRGRLDTIVDGWLIEPYSGRDVLEALGLSSAATAEASVTARSSTDRVHRLQCVVRGCRSLSELERDREELLTQALALFMDVTDSRRGSLLLQLDEPDRLRMVRHSGFPEQALEVVSVRLGEDLAGVVFARGEPMIVELDERGTGKPDRGYQTRSCLIVPLRSKRTTIGVVNLTNRSTGRPYDQDDLSNAVLLADQVAVTLTNARTFADLHEMTVIDPLTQLYNRRHFDHELKKEVERARRHGRKLSLALMDVDHFKSFNDVNGYITGDAVIRRVGSLIRESLREVDVVTRWGGDEFAILMPDTGRPRPEAGMSSINFIERVRVAVETADHSEILPHDLSHVTLSIGVATFPHAGTNEADLFAAANAALRRAKQAGGNRTEWSDWHDGEEHDAAT